MNQGSYDLRRDVDRLKNKTDELAKDYYIQVNSPIVTYKDEVYTPSTIVATAYQSSREITDFYDDGILDLWVSTNGGNSYTYVKQTTSHTISAVINDTTITNYRINLYDEELNLLDRQTIVIVRTTKGSAGQGYDFIYYTTEKESLSQSDYPSGDITKLVGNFNEWLQSPKAIDTLHPNVFMSYRTSDDEGHWGNWSTPVKYNARGERGEDGEGLEMIFCRTQYADDYSLDPSTLNPVQTDDYVPNGWTDDQKGVSSTYCFEYVSMRTKEVPTGSKEAQWGKFSPPKLWATFSEDGKDGKGIELIFARNNDPTTAPTFLNNQDKKTYTGTVNNKHFYDDDFVPQNWTDDQTGVDEDNQCEWVAKRIKKVTNGVASWESFNTPQLWATFSEDGNDGKDAITVMLGNEAQLIAVDGNDSLKSNPTVITIPVYCYKGITRVAGTISLSGISNTFSTKTITRQPSASNDGLITLQCTSVPSQITKDEPITITVDGKTYTKYFTWSKIGDGKDGNAGGTFDFVYYTKNDATTPTISSSTTINANTGRNVVGAWCARPTNVSSSYQYCFGAYRKLDYNGNPTGNYSDVYLWAKYGATGSSGTSHEYAYYTTSSATAPTKPTGDVTATSGLNKWTTVPVTMDATNKYMYISYRINGGTWSDTALWSKFGDKGETGAKGKDGVGLEHIFYLSDTEIDWNTNDNLYNDTVTTDTSSKYSKTNCTLSFNTDRLIMTRTVSSGESYIELRIESPQVLSKYLGKRVRFECDIVSATAGCLINIYQLINGTYSGSGSSTSTTSGHLSKEWVIDKNATRILFRIIGNNTGLNGTCSFRNFKVSSFTDPTKWSTTGDFQNDDYVMSGTGWTDDATGIDETHKFEYCSIRTKTPNEQGTGVWGAFGEPSLWAKFSERGTGAVNVTTAPSTYTTTTGGFIPSYRISLSTAKTQSGLSQILVGDYIRYSYYVYPVGYVDDSYVYLSDRISVRGESGRAVSTVENQYSASSSKTTPPTSNWKTVITQVTTFNSTNKYLWNKEVSKDANGEVISESTPHVIAEYGTNGGISSIVEEYVLSTSTTAPTSGWSSSIPTMSSTNKYLWNHEVITYINNATYTSPAKIIGVYGDRGLQGPQGEEGADGEGLEMIFCRTTTPNGYPSDPSTLPANQTPDYVPSGWTDDQTGVDENNQYEYVCMRTKIPDPNDNTGKSLIWDRFKSPSLWAKWGERGKDGITPTTDGVLAEVIKEIDPENLDAKSLGGLTADEYVEKEPDFELLIQTNNTTGIIECRKLGFLVIINVINWMVKKCTTEGWQWLRKNSNDTSTTHDYTQDIYIPQRFRPANDLLVGGATTSGSNFNDMALRLDNDGRLRIKTNAIANQENINGTFVFFVDSRTATVLTNNTASTLYCGDSLEATLTNSSSGTVLAGKTVTFIINGKNYPRTTDSNGKAKLSLNLNPGSYDYSVLFGGDNSYKPATSIIVANKTLNKVPSNQVKLSSTTPSTVYRTTPFTGYLKNNNDNPISGVTVTVQIGSRTFTGKTNTNGYYKIYHPNDNISYNSINHDTTISVSDNAKTGAKSIPISPIFEP